MNWYSYNNQYASYELKGGRIISRSCNIKIDRMAYAKTVAGPMWDKMTPAQQAEFASKPIKALLILVLTNPPIGMNQTF